MCRWNRCALLAWMAGLTLLGGIAWGANEGQDDLDRATRAKLNYRTLSDLSEVIRLCDRALAKGLDKENTKFARSLLASALSERGTAVCKTIFDSIPPDPRWPEFRRVALEDLEKAVKLDPGLADAHYRIAQLNLLPEGDPKRAAKALDMAVRYSKQDPVLQVQVLILRAGLQKDLTKKLADLNEAARVVPGDTAVLRARGDAYSRAGKFPEALADLDAALKFDPKHAPTLEAKALVLAKMKKFDQALAVVEQVRKLDPKSVLPLVYRAQVHAMKPDFAAALKDLDEALRQEPNDVRPLLLRAAVYQEMKENGKALADVDRALALRPNLDTAVRFRIALLAGEGKFHDAISQVEDLLKAEPDDPDTQLQLAALYIADEKYDKAIKIYSEVLAKDPSSFAALRGRGDAYLSLGKHAEAIADFEKAYKLQPHEPGLLNNFSWVLSTSPFDKLRNGKRALELAKEACRLTDHKAAYILSTLAAAYAELGDFKSAIEWSRKAVALGKEDQKDALAKELQTYLAGKPMRELKAPEPNQKPSAKKPEKPEKSKPATPDKPKAPDRPKTKANPTASK